MRDRIDSLPHYKQHMENALGEVDAEFSIDILRESMILMGSDRLRNLIQIWNFLEVIEDEMP